MNEASRITRESFDKTLETSAQTVRGVQEGVTSALENVRDLNVRLIDMAQGEHQCCFRPCSRSRRSQSAVGYGPGLDNARDQTV